MAKRHSPSRRAATASTRVYTVMLLGLIGTLAVIAFGRQPDQGDEPERRETIVAEFDTVKVPVPLSPVAQGTRARDIKVKYVAFPRHQLPGDVVFDVAPIGDDVTATALPASLPLFRANFRSGQRGVNPVVQSIPDGMRAMTIKVDATAAVEGWAGSGALVDVLLITKTKTRVVAEKVRILSAERSVSPVGEGGTPSVPSTVTLLVSQQQCLAINTAIPLGRIAFALRSAGDEQQWSDPLFTADQLTGSGTPVRDAKAKVTGFITVSGTEKRFALTDGKWVKADSAYGEFSVASDAAH